MKLHIGGTEAREGWTLLNIQPGFSVDIVGSVTDLSMIESESCSVVYASHVLEHLSAVEFARVLDEFHRILAPSGKALVSVPDLSVLARLINDPRRTPDECWHIQRMIYGGQTDEHDFHKIGLTWEFLLHFAHQAGFEHATKVASFGLFGDTSELKCYGVPISLNVELS